MCHLHGNSVKKIPPWQQHRFITGQRGGQAYRNTGNPPISTSLSDWCIWDRKASLQGHLQMRGAPTPVAPSKSTNRTTAAHRPCGTASQHHVKHEREQEKPRETSAKWHLSGLLRVKRVLAGRVALQRLWSKHSSAAARAHVMGRRNGRSVAGHCEARRCRCREKQARTTGSELLVGHTHKFE